MVTLNRTNQSGAVVSFIIVAAVLAVVVIGTAFFVKQRGQQVRTAQAVAQADKVAKQTEAVSPGAKKGDVAVNPPASAPTKSATPAATPTAPSSTQPSNDKSAPLPTTGPESGVIDLLAIGLLVASVSSYAASRRHLSHSL